MGQRYYSNPKNDVSRDILKSPIQLLTILTLNQSSDMNLNVVSYANFLTRKSKEKQEI